MLEQIAQQSSSAITFVGLMLLSGVVSAAPIAGGAGFIRGAAIGAMPFGIPLAFLLSDPHLDSVHATA